MGRPKLTEEQMSKKQLQKQKINERYAMKKKMGTVLTLNNVKKETQSNIFNTRSTVMDHNRIEVPFCDPKIEDLKKLYIGYEKENSDWKNIENKIVTPKGVLYSLYIAGTTSYLIFQSILSMKLLDLDIYSAVSSSIVSEMTPIVCSALIVYAKSRSQKILLSAMMAISICGLCNFFNSSISDSSNKLGEVYKGLVSEKESVLKEIKNLDSQYSIIPDAQITKKGLVSIEMKAATARLSDVNGKISQSESSASGKGGTLYMIWVRVCAIILNCYAIHSFLIFLKK